MEDQDFGWLDTILNLYRRDIERNYGGRTIGKTLNGDEAKAAIQAHFTTQNHFVPGHNMVSQDQHRAELLRARIDTVSHCFAIAEARADRKIFAYLEELKAELDKLEGEK